MAIGEKQFRISFRKLLFDVTQALKWPHPIYSQANLPANTANLVLLRNSGPKAAFFRGVAGKTLAESEEEAAEHAVDFLVKKKKKVIIEDVNVERRNNFEDCCQSFEDECEVLQCAERSACKAALEGSESKTVTVPSTLPKIVVADLWKVWLQVSAAYELAADAVDFVAQGSGMYVCGGFTVTWHDNASKERYFRGERCGNIENAKRSLLKKTIQYFQA